MYGSFVSAAGCLVWGLLIESDMQHVAASEGCAYQLSADGRK